MKTSSRKSTTPQQPVRQSCRKMVKRVMDEYITEFPARGSVSLLGLVADAPPPARRSAPAKKTATAKRNLMVKKQKLAEQRDICFECLQSKSAGQPDGVFLRCISRDCRYVAHSECLKFSRETIELVKDRYKCMNCKRCAVCGKGVVSNDSSLIHCAHCDTLYHMGCHNPPVDPQSSEMKDKSISFANWICDRCTTADQLKLCLEDSSECPEICENEGSESPSLSNSSDGTAVPGYGNGKSLTPLAECSTLTDDELPDGMFDRTHQRTVSMRKDLARWNPDKCARQFDRWNRRELAALVRKHELSGATLLLITREQVINMFNLPLGPALKIHYAICQLRQSFF